MRYRPLSVSKKGISVNKSNATMYFETGVTNYPKYSRLNRVRNVQLGPRNISGKFR